MVTGHFPLCTTEILGGGFTTLTIVREPVERILSHLHHHRAWTPSDRDKSLEEIYSDPQVFHGLVYNHMVKMFSLTPDEVRRSKELQLAGMTRVEFTQERLERAKAGLASVDAVEMYERLDEFFDELASRFGWDLRPSQHQMRVDPRAKRAVGAEVSDSFRARIVEDNAMDIELYRFAQRLYEQRREGPPAGGLPAERRRRPGSVEDLGEPSLEGVRQLLAQLAPGHPLDERLQKAAAESRSRARPCGSRPPPHPRRRSRTRTRRASGLRRAPAWQPGRRRSRGLPQGPPRSPRVICQSERVKISASRTIWRTG